MVLVTVRQLRFFRAAMARGFGRGPHQGDGNGRTPVGATRAKCRRALSWGHAPSATLSRGAAYRLEVDPQPGYRVLRAILSRVFVDG